MSVVLATRYRGRVEMATDGGQWDQHGNLTGTFDKLRISSRLPLAVSGVGDGEQIETLCQYVLATSEGRTVDDTIALLDVGLPDRREITSPIRWELVIACHSETRGPQLWRMRSLMLTDTALPEMRQPIIDYVALGPELTTEELKASGWRSDDFSAGLVAQFEMMRNKADVSLPDLSPGMSMPAGHYVAGHIDHAVVTADGVTMKRIHTWPDEIGQPIRPS